MSKLMLILFVLGIALLGYLSVSFIIDGIKTDANGNKTLNTWYMLFPMAFAIGLGGFLGIVFGPGDGPHVDD